MAFELPFPPFPHDSRDVPFIATPDDNNGYAVPSSQYFKKLVGEKHLWTPVSSDDPMPSSDVAAQAQLAEILAKLSADPATQTTLAAILAKIIAAPATEAKQTALNALIGEVQAAPTANTLLARLKNLETKVDAIIADGIKLSGRKIEETAIVNALEVRDTNIKFYTLDLHAYKSVQIRVKSTLQNDASEPITIKFELRDMFQGYMKAIKADGTVSLIPSISYAISNAESFYPFTHPDWKNVLQGMNKAGFQFTCQATPVSGSITVTLWGVLN